MTTRDNRGRFISADEAAATRVLEAGVREAVRLLRARPLAPPKGTVVTWSPKPVTVTYRYPGDSLDLATRVLADAGRAADLLLTTNGADQ